MKNLFFFSVALFLISCSANAQKPTKEDISKALKSTWEKAATTLEPKKTITINEIKFGTSETASTTQQFEGVPKGAMVTHAKIDFTQNLFYNDETQKTRRIMTAWVYKDAFGDWAIKNAGVIYPDK